MWKTQGPYKAATAFLCLIAAGCSTDSATSGGTSAVSMSTAIGLVESGVEVTGTSLEAVTRSTARKTSRTPISALSVTPFAPSLCDQHGDPQGINESDLKYPYVVTYCGLTVESGDTVIGGFALAKSLICSLEKGDIAFEGTTQEIEVDFTDTECWPSGGPGGTGNSVTISAKGTAPAEFSTYFEKGVEFTVTDFGLTFKIAANVSGDKIEFIAHESWSDGNAGVMSGAIDRDSGVLQFEKRDERVRASCTDSSCGWNKHTRIHATLNMEGGEPAGLESFSFAHSGAHVDAAALTSGNHNAKVVTAEGALDGEIKARLFTHGVTAGNATALTVPANYTETVNAACASGDGINDAATCATETGIGLFTTDTTFMLYTGQTTPADWLASFGGFNFSAVDLNTDVAFD